jgi:hypothetical protein
MARQQKSAAPFTFLLYEAFSYVFVFYLFLLFAFGPTMERTKSQSMVCPATLAGGCQLSSIHSHQSVGNVEC